MPSSPDNVLRKFNSLSACDYFCHLRKTFANSFVQGQAQQNVGHDLDTLMMVLLKEFLE